MLEACCRSPVTLQRDLKRARIVLLAAAGRSTRSIAKEVGVQPRIVSLWRHRYADHDVQYVWRFLRSHKIDLAARKPWCESNDPSIQALERAQGYLKLPNGRALTGQSHDYKRHGTTTLFAALEVATKSLDLSDE